MLRTMVNNQRSLCEGVDKFLTKMLLFDIPDGVVALCQGASIYRHATSNVGSAGGIASLVVLIWVEGYQPASRIAAPKAATGQALKFRSRTVPSAGTKG
jgi:hypothetical protein